MLDHLPPEALVLDLGCRSGSYDATQYKFRSVRVDMVRPKVSLGLFVQADSAHLPFREASFDFVVLNHVLEHFEELEPALKEIGRVVKKDGSVFVAIPDASTFSDKLYRRVFRQSGGHVNRFRSAADVEQTLTRHFGLPLIGTRTLFTSLNFLNRRNTRDPGVRGQMLFGGLAQPLVVALNASTRFVDRCFSTRTSVYGWAFYFGWVGEPVELETLANVCVFCGEAHPSHMLEKWGRVKRKFFMRMYQCPGCGTWNGFVEDRAFHPPRRAVPSSMME